MRHRFLPQALQDLLDLAQWYESQSPGSGDRVNDAVEARAAVVASQPRTHGRVACAPRGREVRVAVVRPFLVLLTYEVTATEVLILSVTHARSVRQPWRRRLGN